MRRFSLTALVGLALVSTPVMAQTFSNLPLATLPLNGIDAVPLDQGSGCATHVQPCVTKEAPSTRFGQPVVAATAPVSPFTFQTWWDISANPAQYKVYNGSTWVAVYQADTATGTPSFPGNVYLPSGNLAIGSAATVPNWPITLFENNTVSGGMGVTSNAYENGSGTVGSVYRGFSTRGSQIAPTSVQTNDVLGAVHASGFWSGKPNAYFIGGDARAAMEMQAAENWVAATNNGTQIVWKTTPAAGSTIAEVARLDSNGLLGIGSTAPNFGVTLTRNNPIPAGTLTQGFTVNTYENSTGLTGGGFRSFTTRGTAASPTLLVTNDPLLVLSGSGFWTGKTNAFWSGSDQRASIGMFAAENWAGANNNGTYMNFSVTATGAGVQTERMRLSAAGGLSVGTTTDPGANNLLVSGNIELGLSSALTLAAGELGIGKIVASGTAPGAAGGKIALVCGTGAGTAKLIAYAGTSVTPTTILDNIGGAVTGC